MSKDTAMRPPRSWRTLALALVLANVGFWAWREGHLRPLGWGPQVVREPQRLENQVAPELLTVTPLEPTAIENR